MGNYHRQPRVKNLVTLFLGAVDRPSTRCPAHLTGSWRGPDTPSTGGGPHTQPTADHHENRLENEANLDLNLHFYIFQIFLFPCHIYLINTFNLGTVYQLNGLQPGKNHRNAKTQTNGLYVYVNNLNICNNASILFILFVPL